MTNPNNTILCTIPTNPARHGRAWAKHITSVNEKARTGHDYHGDWVNQGRRHDLPLGAVIVCGGQSGNLKNGNRTADFYVVGPDGVMLNFQYLDTDEWAIDARDEVRKVLAMTTNERIVYAAGEMRTHFGPQWRSPVANLPIDALKNVIDRGGQRQPPGCPPCTYATIAETVEWAKATDEQKAAALALAQQHLAEGTEVMAAHWAKMDAIIASCSPPTNEAKQTVTITIRCSEETAGRLRAMVESGELAEVLGMTDVEII